MINEAEAIVAINTTISDKCIILIIKNKYIRILKSRWLSGFSQAFEIHIDREYIL